MSRFHYFLVFLLVVCGVVSWRFFGVSVGMWVLFTVLPFALLYVWWLDGESGRG